MLSGEGGEGSASAAAPRGEGCGTSHPGSPPGRGCGAQQPPARLPPPWQRSAQVLLPPSPPSGPRGRRRKAGNFRPGPGRALQAALSSGGSQRQAGESRAYPGLEGRQRSRGGPGLDRGTAPRDRRPG